MVRMWLYPGGLILIACLSRLSAHFTGFLPQPGPHHRLPDPFCVAEARRAGRIRDRVV